MQIFFDGRYRVDGQGGVPVKLGFRDTIFVMEDIDAASKVVRRRDGKQTADFVQSEPVELPPTKSLFQMFLESNDRSVRDLVKKLMDLSPRLREEAKKPEVIRAMVDRATTLPGLSFVGLTPNQQDIGDRPTNVLNQIGQDALSSANKLLTDYQAIDKYLASHAASIKSMLDLKPELDEEIVDTLLGITDESSEPSFYHIPPPSGHITKETSYTRTG